MAQPFYKHEISWIDPTGSKTVSAQAFYPEEARHLAYERAIRLGMTPTMKRIDAPSFEMKSPNPSRPD